MATPHIRYCLSCWDANNSRISTLISLSSSVFSITSDVMTIFPVKAFAVFEAVVEVAAAVADVDDSALLSNSALTANNFDPVFHKFVGRVSRRKYGFFAAVATSPFCSSSRFFLLAFQHCKDHNDQRDSETIMGR